MSVAADWRLSATLGGPNPDMPERAHPGMRPHQAPLMAEHAMRYALALALVGGKHVLDLGCGVGYGSEMLTWSALSVRGFDVWQPAEEERPEWGGGADLVYGHDLCTDPLPAADMAVMFETLEHLADAPAALRIIWGAVDEMLVSFPNPVYHGSHHNPYHVNDWPLKRVEREIWEAARPRFRQVAFSHLHQQAGGLVKQGRNPDGYYWLVYAQGRP